METMLVLLLMPSLVVAERAFDPSHAMFVNKADARNMECERLTHQRAQELYPGQVRPTPARVIDQRVEALACRQRYVRWGERSARDELILSSLRRSVGEIAESAGALADGSDLTWHVDAFYPDSLVAQKISIAARTELAEKGRRVSDRVPMLAAGDLAVLRGMPPQDAYRIACKRYFDQQSLGEKEAFLGIMLVDPRETQLHAGVCMGGQWRWLQ